MKMLTILAATAALLSAAPGVAAPSSGDAEIPFVSHDGIQSWIAPNDNTIYLQGTHSQWYRADLMGPCTGLSFASGIGFKTGFGDTFDDSSSIIVNGQPCPVASVTKVSGPPAAQNTK